jgi:HAD superfamily hydrolase (TIGR01509 family)
LIPRYSVFDYFNELFLSYEIGSMKPTAAIFQHVLAVLNVAPQQVAFFDDGRRNVEAAQAMGMQAFRVNSPDEILAIVSP